ncbi:hypothetical protein ARMGADRAFT_1040658 [Armillaria gallica]|uniref:Uncharacterized protein n=1 Tax=Armillaria gallica TaxID=47427 RepID=A0A2H3CCP4_ARMGA|nr:hypothetical protein ARMGADRAFT_1040658 [Armillaria gallica]
MLMGYGTDSWLGAEAVSKGLGTKFYDTNCDRHAAAIKQRRYPGIQFRPAGRGRVIAETLRRMHKLLNVAPVSPYQPVSFRRIPRQSCDEFGTRMDMELLSLGLEKLRDQLPGMNWHDNHPTLTVIVSTLVWIRVDYPWLSNTNSYPCVGTKLPADE